MNDNAIETARVEFRNYVTEIGSDPIVEENAILGVGREFLPPCAIAVLDDRAAVTVEYYEWLLSQTREAQEEHVRNGEDAASGGREIERRNEGAR